MGRMEKWWKSHKQQLEEKLEEKRLKSAPQVHSTHVLRRIPKYPKTVAAVVVCMLLFAILLSVSVGAAVPFLTKVNWSRVGRIGAIILLVIILLVTFWKLEKSRKWIGGAVALTTLVAAVWVGSKYFNFHHREDPKLLDAERRVDSLRIELQKTIEGNKQWIAVVRKSMPDSIEIAIGDSIWIQRQDSLPFKIILAGNKIINVAYPLKETLPPLPKSGWMKIVLDSTTSADSIHIGIRTWRGKWNQSESNTN